MPKLCEACERRMHLWAAGKEKNPALCPGCAKALVEWRNRPENAWLKESP